MLYLNFYLAQEQKIKIHNSSQMPNNNNKESRLTDQTILNQKMDLILKLESLSKV